MDSDAPEQRAHPMRQSQRSRRISVGRVKATKSSEALADVLREQILAGGFDEGTSLPSERDIVDETGLGRGSVREALRVLEVEGLIRTKTGRHGGAFATRPRRERYLALRVAVRPWPSRANECIARSENHSRAEPCVSCRAQSDAGRRSGTQRSLRCDGSGDRGCCVRPAQSGLALCDRHRQPQRVTRRLSLVH